MLTLVLFVPSVPHILAAIVSFPSEPNLPDFLHCVLSILAPVLHVLSIWHLVMCILAAIPSVSSDPNMSRLFEFYLFCSVGSASCYVYFGCHSICAVCSKCHSPCLTSCSAYFGWDSGVGLQTL